MCPIWELKELDELVNLKFLSMDGANALKVLPAGLFLKLPNLQCLHLAYHIEAPVIELESLTKLEEFRGRLNDAADFNKLIGCREIVRYSIIVRNTPENEAPRYFRYSQFSDNNEVNVVGFNYHMEDAMLAHNVQHLILDKCLGLSKSLLDSFPKFNNLKSLRMLRIYVCKGIECILGKNGELESHSVSPLGTINEIHLYGLPDFMGIIKKEGIALPTPAQAVFSSLRELFIRDCKKMKNLGLTGSEFPNLELIEVENCEEIEEIIEEGGVVSFPKLKWLLLWDLPKLKHVGTTVCPSIEKIYIKQYPALKKLPLYFPVMIDGGESSNVSYSPPHALKGISIHRAEEEWWESLEWEHPSHKLLLQPFLKFL